MRLLLIARMRHLDLIDGEAVFLREQLIDRDRLTAIGRAVVEHDDFLALELIETALTAGEIVDNAGGLAVGVEQ